MVRPCALLVPASTIAPPTPISRTPQVLPSSIINTRLCSPRAYKWPGQCMKAHPLPLKPDLPPSLEPFEGNCLLLLTSRAAGPHVSTRSGSRLIPDGANGPLSRPCHPPDEKPHPKPRNTPRLAPPLCAPRKPGRRCWVLGGKGHVIRGRDAKVGCNATSHTPPDHRRDRPSPAPPGINREEHGI